MFRRQNKIQTGFSDPKTVFVIYTSYNFAFKNLFPPCHLQPPTLENTASTSPRAGNNIRVRQHVRLASLSFKNSFPLCEEKRGEESRKPFAHRKHFPYLLTPTKSLRPKTASATPAKGSSSSLV